MEVSGDRSRELYRKEVHEGVKIFEKSFQDMQKSKLAPQKTEYEKAMDESLQAIQDAAKGLANESILRMKQQLAKDYHNFLKDPSNENKNKVEHDIDDLKKS